MMNALALAPVVLTLTLLLLSRRDSIRTARGANVGKAAWYALGLLVMLASELPVRLAKTLFMPDINMVGPFTLALAPLTAGFILYIVYAARTGERMKFTPPLFSSAVIICLIYHLNAHFRHIFIDIETMIPGFPRDWGSAFLQMIGLYWAVSLLQGREPKERYFANPAAAVFFTTFLTFLYWLGAWTAPSPGLAVLYGCATLFNGVALQWPERYVVRWTTLRLELVRLATLAPCTIVQAELNYRFFS